MIESIYWLQTQRHHDGFKCRPMEVCTFVRRFRDAPGFNWIQDGLRHAAATYHFALYGDAAKTAALLGERDIRTLLEHYKGLATEAEAEEFYALRPGSQTAILRRLDVSSEAPTKPI